MMHVKCKFVVTIVWNNFVGIKSTFTIRIHEISLNKAFLASILDLVHSLNNKYFQAYVQILKPYWKIVI